MLWGVMQMQKQTKRVSSGSSLFRSYSSRALNMHFQSSQLSVFFLCSAGSKPVRTAISAQVVIKIMPGRYKSGIRVSVSLHTTYIA